MKQNKTEQTKHDRLSDMLEWAFDTSLGTNWFVREDLWKERLDKYDKTNTRRCHPGLSMRSTRVAHFYETVHMLHGTSYREDLYCGPIQVRGLTKKRGDDHITCFGLHIAPVLMREIAQKDPNGDSDILEGDPFASKKVLRNLHKPVLNDEEMQHYKAWLKAKGLLHDEQN
jgi:hypothetical protein